MRKMLLAAGALATLATAALPSLASAYTTRCEEKAHDRKVTGTVIGGVLGALAGNAISKGGGGAVVGGVAGAAVGNNLSRTHCQDGYRQRVYDERYYDVERGRYHQRGYERRCTWRQERFRDERGYWVTRDVQVCR